MANSEAIPELKKLVGALIFAANRPLAAKDIRKCLQEVSEIEGGETRVFADARQQDVDAAVSELRADIEKAKLGFSLAEVGGGLRYQSDASCGKWVRYLLAAGKPARLSLPALETLAIIAYRQPITKPDIELIRGVNVDYIIKTLLETQLVRITGRSDLAGRPFMYGTTQAFLEHFGLKGLQDLGDMEPFLAAAREQEKARDAKQAAEATFEKGQAPEQPVGEPGHPDTDSTGAAAPAPPGTPPAPGGNT